ncbi:MAG: ribonuclease D [Rhodobacteraceae bacterium]|nr:ribonuclease D [Paracoccaceae bacterium]
MSITLFDQDVPDDYDAGAVLAVDTETMGLNVHRDRLCLVQMSRGDDAADLVRIRQGQARAPNLDRIFSDPAIVKIFHYARADMAVLRHWLGIDVRNVYCTKIASRLTRTNSGQHGLRALVQDILEIEIQKDQQSSDWGAEILSENQQIYAASDVLYLRALREALDARLVREGRGNLAKQCFAFLPHRVALDLGGWHGDIFAH